MDKEFESPDGLYSVSEIEAYLKKNGEKINDNINPSMKTYGNKVENRITFKVKTGYYLQLLKP